MTWNEYVCRYANKWDNATYDSLAQTLDLPYEIQQRSASNDGIDRDPDGATAIGTALAKSAGQLWPRDFMG